MSQHVATKRLTAPEITARKGGEPIVSLTSYHAHTAAIADKYVDFLLVGDSLGMVVQGHESTLPVTLEHMIYHSAMVRRGLTRAGARAHLVGDLPFGSYQASQDEAVKAAMRLVSEGGVEAVKLEGGADYAEVIRRMVRAGVPVMGHIGLTPQSVHKLGGYVVQGKDAERAQALLRDARALESAGCYAIVLEAVPAPVATAISERLHIPTIGIGAGPGCDGQVLVYHDILGLYDRVQPSFVKEYARLQEPIREAFAAYRQDVTERRFPAAEHSFTMKAEELEAFQKSLDQP